MCIQDKLWFCPMLNKLSRNVPQGPRGGILAEEMGLGKTVEVLSLVLAAPAPPDRKSGVKVKSKDGTLIRSRGTLVVCKVRSTCKGSADEAITWYKNVTLFHICSPKKDIVGT